MLWVLIFTWHILLKNINLILAFIINIISKLIEHLDISPASTVRTNTEMHMVLYITIEVYTAIMKICLSIACVAQWVEHVIIAQLFLSAASLVRIPYATFIIVKTFVFIFIKFSRFCNIVSPFCLVWFHRWQKYSLVGSVTLYFNYRLSPLQFLRYLHEMRHEISNNVKLWNE